MDLFPKTGVVFFSPGSFPMLSLPREFTIRQWVKKKKPNGDQRFCMFCSFLGTYQQGSWGTGIFGSGLDRQVGQSWRAQQWVRTAQCIIFFVVCFVFVCFVVVC